MTRASRSEELAAARSRIRRRVVPDADYHQNRYAKALDEFVRPGCRWLDLGAGHQLHGGWVGASESDLARRAGLLVGCDLEADALKINPSLTLAVTANAKALPFATGTFDLVSANMVVEHLDNPDAGFAEIRRILAPGGVFVFVTPNKASMAVGTASLLLPQGVRKRIAEAIEGRSEADVFPTYYRANTASAIQRLARATGFRIRVLDFFSTFPIPNQPLTLLRVECLWIRILRLDALSRFRSNVVCCLEAA